MNKLYFLSIYTLIFVNACFAQTHQLKVFITNDYKKPLTISYLDDKGELVKLPVNAHDALLYTITPEQNLHLKPRVFELDGKAYQVKFSVAADKYKVEVWDAVKRTEGIRLGNKTHSIWVKPDQNLSFRFNKNGNLSLKVDQKEKLP